MTKIITTPNPLLRQVSTPINKLDKKTLKIIHNVQETLKTEESPRGVGLSAVQIAKPIRAFCTHIPPSGDPNDEKQKPVISTFINPQIIKVSKQKTLGPKKNDKPILEGCLSIPGIWGPVWRHKWIKLKYYTLDVYPERSRRAKSYTLRERSKRFSDFPARVIQHEIDHLNGILFTDHSLREKLPFYESKDEELVEIVI
jgi:peptide deformylase